MRPGPPPSKWTGWESASKITSSPGCGVQLDGDLVGHGGRWQEEGFLLAQERGDPSLELEDGGIFASLFVADGRLHHGLAHPRRRPGGRIAKQIDQDGATPQCFL